MFVNALLMMQSNLAQSIIAKQSPKDQGLFTQDSSFDAGYATYSGKVTCRVDEDYFPSFLLQAGACHQQIYPAFDSLSSWRLRMVLDD